MINQIQWLDLCRFCFVHYNILPQQFWDMTFLELQSIVAENNKSLINRDELNKLIKQFPD
jgi:hypothetical protein